jgi:hypothetical protein
MTKRLGMTSTLAALAGLAGLALLQGCGGPSDESSLLTEEGEKAQLLPNAKQEFANLLKGEYVYNHITPDFAKSHPIHVATIDNDLKKLTRLTLSQNFSFEYSQHGGFGEPDRTVSGLYTLDKLAGTGPAALPTTGTIHFKGSDGSTASYTFRILRMNKGGLTQLRLASFDKKTVTTMARTNAIQGNYGLDRDPETIGEISFNGDGTYASNLAEGNVDASGVFGFSNFDEERMGGEEAPLRIVATGILQLYKGKETAPATQTDAFNMRLHTEAGAETNLILELGGTIGPFAGKDLRLIDLGAE